MLGRDAREPRALDALVRLGALGRSIPQARHDRHRVAILRERLEDLGHREILAGLLGRPEAHHGAVREADEREALRRLRGRVRPCDPGRKHRVEQGQRDADPHAAEHRAS
jgi:hypothetical protein